MKIVRFFGHLSFTCVLNEAFSGLSYTIRVDFNQQTKDKICHISCHVVIDKIDCNFMILTRYIVIQFFGYPFIRIMIHITKFQEK